MTGQQANRLKLTFDEAQIRALFGSEDAESEKAERFHEYFVKNHAYDNLIADLPLRIIIGHKGVGKKRAASLCI